MPNEEKLKSKLKEALEESQAREAAKRIWDKATATLGSDSFVHRAESEVLATVDEAKLRQFVDEVMAIRQAVGAEYKEAILALATEKEEE